MSVRLKPRLASQQALADLPLPKHMLHASQSSCSSKSNRECWALSWGRGDFFQSVRTVGSAVLSKAIFHLSKEAMPRKNIAELFSPPEIHCQRDGEDLEEAAEAAHARHVWGHGTFHSPAVAVQHGCVTNQAFRSSSFICSAGSAAK